MKYSIPYLGFNSLNVSFFLNHSKIPNLSVVSDKCEYMGFRTNLPIRKGEELFINYGDYADNFEELMSFQKPTYTCEFMKLKNK
jgi:SET domain-containing protein